MAFTWSDVTIPTTGGLNFRDFIEDTGHGVLCAVGGTGLVYTTSNGTTWTARTASEANDWRGVAYAPTLGTAGRLCAVANGGTHRVMTSDNGGVTWTNQTASEANPWNAVDWVPWLNSGNGLFVAVASSGTHRVMTSPDGLAWTNQTAASAKGWCGIDHSSSTVVAICSTAGTQRIMTSPDAVTWTLAAASADTQQNGSVCGHSALTYSPTLNIFAYIAQPNGGGNFIIRTSADHGATWTSTGFPTASFVSGGIRWLSLVNLFLTPGNSGASRNYVVTSANGVTWAEVFTGMFQIWDCVGWMSSTLTVVAWGQGTNTHMLTGVAPPLPTVTRVVPFLGRVLGGKLVTIYGTNFSGTPVVTFGGTPGTSVQVLSSTRLRVRTPAHTAGLVDVVVDGGTLTNGYRYTDSIFGDLTIRQEQGIVIDKELNDAPDTCDFTSDGVSSVGVGAPIQIIDPASGATLFGGTALVTTDTIDGRPSQVGHQGINSGDLTWRLNALRPVGIWTEVSASTVYQDLIDQFAPQFTGIIEAGLPTVSITCDRSQTLSEVFSTLAVLAQCSWRPDDNFGVEVFTVGGSPLPGLPPDPVTDDTPLYDPPPTVVTDITQVRNRVYVSGAGGASSYIAAVGVPLWAVGLYTSPAGVITPTAGGSIPTGSYGYFMTWTTEFGETYPTYLTSYLPVPSLTGANHSYQLAHLDQSVSPDPHVTGRRLWRTRSDALFTYSPWEARLVASFGNTSGIGEDTYLDTKADADLTVRAPKINTTGSVFVMEENTAAQTYLAALLNVDGGADDGVREGWVSDSSLTTNDQATARGNAELALFAYPIQTVTYACRDEKSRPGEDVSITLTKPPVSGVFKIQSVKIDQVQIDAAGALFPRFTVTASSLRFTLDDLLRGLVLGGGGSGGAGSGSSASSSGGGSTSPSVAIRGPEIPTGTIGGSPANSVFTTALAFTTIWVFKNGLLFNAPTDYTVTGSDEITLVVPPLTGDSLVVYYL